MVARYAFQDLPAALIAGLNNGTLTHHCSQRINAFLIPLARVVKIRFNNQDYARNGASLCHIFRILSDVLD